MPSLLIPALTALSGGLLIRDYKRRRLQSPEDRYMALYGNEDWASNNMDMRVHFDPALDKEVKASWICRLKARLPLEESMLSEVGEVVGDELVFRKVATSIEALLKPRQGIWFDLATPGLIHITWNHLQVDGVGLWRELREVYDENPPLIPYRSVSVPPPIVPEIMGIPQMAKSVTIRGSLHKEMDIDRGVEQHFTMWDGAKIRAFKNQCTEAFGKTAPFNLVTAAIVADRIFTRHPAVKKLNLGLTIYFPFLESRNKYGVQVRTVKRDSIQGIVKQLMKKQASPVAIWGAAAAQGYALNRVPNKWFMNLMQYFRKQIDVLIANVPVGQVPVTVGNKLVQVSCHTRELSLPYYVLLMGTRGEVHTSMTTRYKQDDHTRMMELPDLV